MATHEDSLLTDDGEVGEFDEKEDFEACQRALEEALLTPPPSEVPEEVFHVRLPVRSDPNSEERSPCDTCSKTMVEDDRFEGFTERKVTSTFEGAFTAARRFKRIHKRQLPPVRGCGDRCLEAGYDLTHGGRLLRDPSCYITQWFRPTITYGTEVRSSQRALSIARYSRRLAKCKPAG